MKKSFIIFLGIFMLLFTACENFLREENLSSVVADGFYAKKSGYESLVNSCYSSLRKIYGEEPLIFIAGTDIYAEGKSDTPQTGELSGYRNLTPSNSDVKTLFTTLYSSIQLCNTAIFFNDKTEVVSTLAQRLAEVRFIRAIDYFKLVQHFGGVSIVKEMVNEPLVSFERKSAEEVYNFIISELEAAKVDLPETTTQFGRATKRAANHYLAKAYLTKGYESFGIGSDFTTAATYAETAINGLGLNLTYETLFTPGKEKNEEIIFSIQYDKASMLDPAHDGHMQNAYYSDYLGGEGNQYGYPYRSSYVPNLYLLNLYNRYDSRWEATFMTVVYQRYYDYFDKASERAKMVVNYYYPQSWELADTAAWRAASPLRAKTKIRSYDGSSAGSSSDWTSPIVKKFDDPTANFSKTGSSSRDMFLARLGETYLIAAEAYLKSGNVGKAVEKLNVVRSRAAKPGHKAEMQLTAGQVDIDVILDERALELLGEYHRWEDLKRAGKLVERTRKYNLGIKAWFDNGINPFEGQDGQLKILRPIPQDALDLNQNKEFTQNPGY